MPLKLSQVLDLAIGVDNASVNLLHLREVLVTVITTLDIGHVGVKNEEDKIDEPVVGDDKLEAFGDDQLRLSENEIPGNTLIDQDELSNVRSNMNTTARDDENTFIDENEENANEHDVTNHETNDETGKHETQIKVRTVDTPKLKRSESGFSNVSNISTHARNSTLASKVFALEENLKRLQSIVGSLISQVDANNNVLNSDLGQVEANTGHPRPLGKIGNSSIQYRESVTSLEPGREWVDDSNFVGDLTRPATQPVLASSKLAPILSRSKTAGFSVKKNKQLRRQGSLPLNLKTRRFVPTISEETQLGEHMIREVNEDKLGTRDGHEIKEVTEDRQLSEGEIEGDAGDKQDIQGEEWIDDDNSKDIQLTEEHLPSDIDSEEDVEDRIERVFEAALNDPGDPQNMAHAMRLGLEQMKRIREEFQLAQENVRSEVETCKNYIQSFHEAITVLKTEKKNQETEQFNALHHVHRQIIELEQKQTKLSKTLNELVDEFNRHESSFSDIRNSLDKLDEHKVDKVFLSTKVDDKANKDELLDKVSLSMFDESFSLLDQALGDALEKMANQMSMEEAMRETLNEMQSGMEMKLNREDMESLKIELEARIKEVRAAQEKGLVGKNEVLRDPAGFKRYVEKARCISCDHDVEIEPSRAPARPSLPQSQPLARIPRSRDVNKKVIDDKYRLSKLKADMISGTGLHDLTMFPMSQRFCGGRHTITRGNKRFLGPTLNDYIVIHETDHVTLPSREFIVQSRDSGRLRRFTKRKLPAIDDLKHLPDIREEGNILKANGDCENCDESEQTTRIEK